MTSTNNNSSTNILQVLNATSQSSRISSPQQLLALSESNPLGLILSQQQQQQQQLINSLQLLTNQQQLDISQQQQQLAYQQQQLSTLTTAGGAVSPISHSSNGGHSSNHSHHSGQSSNNSNGSSHHQVVSVAQQQQQQLSNAPTSNTLMFINETTADVLNRGSIPTFDLNAPPSTPPQKNRSSNNYSTPPNNYSNLNSPLLAHLNSPPSLKKTNSASTLHNTTSLRMKKHSGLGNFKANYFELEMKKKPKGGGAANHSKSHLDLSDSSHSLSNAMNSAMNQQSINLMGPNGIPPNMSPRRGIEKSPSFSKKNSLLNLDRNSLAAALNLQNSLNQQQQLHLQEVGNKKFSLSFSDNNLDENQKLMNSIGNALYGGNSSQSMMNLTSNGGGISCNDHLHTTILNPSGNQTNQQLLNQNQGILQYNRTAQQNGIMAQSTPELQAMHQQQALYNSLLFGGGGNQSGGGGVFQQMSTSYPNLQQQFNINQTNVGQQQSDFDDMLDSLLNEEDVANELSFDNVNINNSMNCSTTQQQQYGATFQSSNAPSTSPLSFFYRENSEEQDQSLIADMDNFFLSSSASNDHLQERIQQEQDDFLPLRPINPQEVMKEWEHSNNTSNMQQIDFEILNQF